jgi:D-alanyl-D-alanine carboxypeptidase
VKKVYSAGFILGAALFLFPLPLVAQTQTSEQTELTAKIAAAIPRLSLRTQQVLQRSIGGDEERARAFLTDLSAVLAADKDLDLLLFVDKTHALPSYVPTDLVTLKSNVAYLTSRNGLQLRSVAEAALRRMGEAARAAGITLLASSAYRSFDYQVTAYARNVRILGQGAADRESARPGTSQHQLGTVVDFGSISVSFADTAAGRFIAEHAPEYGWSLSFPEGYEDVTGYLWECWHWRYIGVEAVRFQAKWFDNIQQFMLEFIDALR